MVLKLLIKIIGSAGTFIGLLTIILKQLFVVSYQPSACFYEEASELPIHQTKNSDQLQEGNTLTYATC